MRRSALELAEEMGIDLDHLGKLWGTFYLHSIGEHNKPYDVKEKLTDKEINYLLTLGFSQITDTMRKEIVT